MKEGNVLFKDRLDAFYLQLYGVKHMVKDHSFIERENLLLPRGLLLVTSHGALAGTRNSSMGPP